MNYEISLMMVTAFFCSLRLRCTSCINCKRYVIALVFVADVCNTDLSKINIQGIVAVLKKFLQELPDPVIPVQWYDKFLEAAGETQFHYNYSVYYCLRLFR